MEIKGPSFKFICQKILTKNVFLCHGCCFPNIYFETYSETAYINITMIIAVVELTEHSVCSLLKTISLLSEKMSSLLHLEDFPPLYSYNLPSLMNNTRILPVWKRCLCCCYPLSQVKDVCRICSQQS